MSPMPSLADQPQPDPGPDLKTATFAGGCFWCMQPPYDRLEGVVSVTVGYTGGNVPNPTYEQVSTGRTGHVEAVQVVYDPPKVAYRDLLRIFWRSIDPIDTGGQFADRGSQYRTAIYYHDEEQRAEAERSKQEIRSASRLHGTFATLILPAKPFYPAEEYHQSYYKKNAAHYNAYRAGSGRSDYLKKTWGTGEAGH